jgi:hypothetical protein
MADNQISVRPMRAESFDMQQLEENFRTRAEKKHGRKD